MAANNSKFLVTALDFDGIKNSLKNFLRSQQEFTDYDFEGSGLAVLLDILSYNTHYLAFYLNMVANEMFLDSADLRANVVSIAKQLSYVPLSRTSATAMIDVLITPNVVNPPASITIDQFTPFSTNVDGTIYTFVTNQAYTVGLDVTTGTYSASLVVREGTGLTFQFLVDNSVPGQRFVIPNSNVDTSTITVRVQASSTNTAIQVYTLANDINVVNNNSLVYFLEETEDTQYEIYFGDGIIGLPPADQSIVIVNYVSCNADAANGASVFTPASTVGGFQNVQVTTTNAAFGGAERESIDSVKFSAPKNFEMQNRAVTANDYITLLRNKYPNVNSLAVWGGENNIPPAYGKVFISLQPATGFVITNATKQDIINNILSQYNVVTVTPEIIDPDYIFISINSLVKYTPNLTTLTAGQIQQLVLTTISGFSGDQVNQFDKIFRFSVLTRQIDLSENSITNDLTSIQIQKRFIPTLNQFQNVTLSFNSNNPIVPGTISSGQFVVSQDSTYTQAFQAGDLFAFKDDGLGNLQVFKQVGTNQVIVKAKAGTIDYVNGIINVVNFVPSSVVNPSGAIKVFANPVTSDVVPVRNNIIFIDPLDVTVTAVPNSTLLV